MTPLCNLLHFCTLCTTLCILSQRTWMLSSHSACSGAIVFENLSISNVRKTIHSLHGLLSQLSEASGFYQIHLSIRTPHFKWLNFFLKKLVRGKCTQRVPSSTSLGLVVVYVLKDPPRLNPPTRDQTPSFRNNFFGGKGFLYSGEYGTSFLVVIFFRPQ